MGELGLLAIMVGATYATRVAGYLARDRLGASDKLDKWLERLSGAVLALILAGALVNAPWAVIVGVAVAVFVMLLSSRLFAGIWLGVAATAIVRLIG